MTLRTLKPSVRTLTTGPRKVESRSDQRVWGRASQARRLRLWTVNPCCVDCGRLTDYPSGFELDHEIPVEVGGTEDDNNLKVRCVWWDDQGRKQGCHEVKTQREKRQAGR